MNVKWQPTHRKPRSQNKERLWPLRGSSTYPWVRGERGITTFPKTILLWEEVDLFTSLFLRSIQQVLLAPLLWFVRLLEISIVPFLCLVSDTKIYFSCWGRFQRQFVGRESRCAICARVWASLLPDLPTQVNPQSGILCFSWKISCIILLISPISVSLLQAETSTKQSLSMRINMLALYPYKS